jgi:F0F1-type ATP synthase assembly protein I
MSWRLAIVVIVPIVVGALLDDHYKVGALYLIIGLVLALILAVLVVYQSYLEANKLTTEMLKGLKGKKKNAR